MREPQEHTTEINLGALGDVPCRVWYFYTPADPGRVSGPPENCYPPEPAEVEYTKFEIQLNEAWVECPFENLDKDTQDSLEQSIIEAEEDRRAEAFVDAYERAHGCDYTDDWP